MLKEDFYDLINQQIKLRDNHQFEVKLDYNIDPALKRNEYKVEAYFFIPRSLYVNDKTYPIEKFFQDIDSKIRFKTPRMSISTLLDFNNYESPYLRVYRLLSLSEKTNNAAIIRELKLLISIIKSSVRDGAARVIRSLGKKGSKHRLKGFLYNIDYLKEKFKKLKDKATAAPLSDDAKTAFKFADEFLSITIEKSIINIFQEYNKKEKSKKIKKELAKYIRRETQYRTKQKYLTLPNQSIDNEIIAYREGVLKRFFASVLFLKLRKRTENRRATDLLYALAAGIAMFVAIIITVYSTIKFVITSLPFIMIGVIGYMLKDRMKDWLKAFFSKKISAFYPKKSFHIYDSFIKRNIGSCKNAANYIDIKDVPKRILEVREMDLLTKLESEGRPEEVIKYERWVSLFTNIIEKDHERTKNINDIIRFNAFEFIQRCDNPDYEYFCVSEKEDKLKSIKCAKVYHLNVVFKFSFITKSGKNKYFLKRVRAVLDKNGIKRIESLY